MVILACCSRLATYRDDSPQTRALGLDAAPFLASSPPGKRTGTALASTAGVYNCQLKAQKGDLRYEKGLIFA